MRDFRTAALPVAAALWLAGCGGTPDEPEVTDRRDLDVDISSSTVASTSLGARAVYWSDDRVDLEVDSPWEVDHRFDHPIFKQVADACADTRPPEAWRVVRARLMDGGDTVATLVGDGDEPIAWQDLDELELPEETDGSETLDVTLRFSDDAAPVEGTTQWRVRAGGASASLHQDLEARVTGISAEPGRASIDGELVRTRHLDVELSNTGNATYTLDADRSGAGLEEDLLSMSSDQAGTLSAGSRTVVQIPLQLPEEVESRLGSSSSLERVSVEDMPGWQWHGQGDPLAQRQSDAEERFQGAAYIVARDQDGHERTGFVDADIVLDRLDRITAVHCPVGNP